MYELSYPVTDIHVHIQPWAQLHPQTREVMAHRRADLAELEAMMLDPQAVLDCMDEAGVHRTGMINYVAPRLMGFTDEVNPWVAEVARFAPRRLLAFGGFDPRDPGVAADPGAAVDRLLDLGIRGLKIRPPHQELRAHAYRKGAAEEHLPVSGGHLRALRRARAAPSASSR